MQKVTAWGEYDDVDVAMAELGAHYARRHPELDDSADDDEEVVHGGAALLLA